MTVIYRPRILKFPDQKLEDLLRRPKLESNCRAFSANLNNIYALLFLVGFDTDLLQLSFVTFVLPELSSSKQYNGENFKSFVLSGSLSIQIFCETKHNNFTWIILYFKAFKGTVVYCAQSNSLFQHRVHFEIFPTQEEKY